MEENKEIKQFGQQAKIIEKIPFARRRKEGSVQDEENLIEIKLDRGVIIKLIKDDDIFNYKSLDLLEHIIRLDNERPELIHSFEPPLYKDFITIEGQINTIVNIGDIVKTKRKYMDVKENIPREVTDLYFKSLNNMTVIIAVLNDNDFYVANRLELCK